ncbi:carbon-nitrogen hydrolase family protein [Nocardia sp. NBC_01503]|uniref:nitrilase-related carbon-nitrogen hydrolase n=1 Tax=Nocardia sp. NBC_01503 TaxID=2975997 RepID=UPI002E7BE286|nr:nitrilase-related carbon-nitrogen hydrolase [Nocardia sp. NBC_01503]WTL33875.1 carbon-nitrogen hydrolase family protein [Nocardia sp. NBC_01503]
MRRTVRVAAIQAEPKWLRLSEGAEQVVELIGHAAAAGARLVAFPETFLPGFPWWRWVDSNQWNAEYSTRCRENSMTRDGAEMRRITAAARDHGVQVVLGFGERQDRRIYMAQAVIDENGDIVSVRRKAGLNSIERKVFASGTPNLPTVQHGVIGKVGALSGQENQRPLLTRALRADEEQIHIAAWPGHPEGDVPGPDSAPTVSRMYALEAHAYVVAPCAVVGSAAWDRRAPQTRRSTGQARIYGASGTDIVTPLTEGVEGILYADLEVGSVAPDRREVDLAPRHRARRGQQAARTAPPRRLGADRWAVPLIRGTGPDGMAAC